MTLRPAYPDELGRAQSLLDGHPVPAHAAFLVAVKEQPVERLLAAIPWWRVPGTDGQPASLRFFLAGSGTAWSENLEAILSQLEALARQHEAAALFTDFALPEAHPLFHALTAHGYGIFLTDRYFSMPGASVNQRCKRLYRRAAGKIPATWKVESIRGQAPEKIFELVGAHGLMSPHQFQSYWNTANREHFEERYSCVVLEEEQIIGVFLVTRRGEGELHIHVDAVSPRRKAVSGLITIAMRHFVVSAMPEGFPEIYTSRVDSEKHLEGGNTPLRYGGMEAPPRHFLKKDQTMGQAFSRAQASSREIPQNRLASVQRPSPGVFRFSAHAEQKASACRIAMQPEINANVGMSALISPHAAGATTAFHQRNPPPASASFSSPLNTKSSRLTGECRIGDD